MSTEIQKTGSLPTIRRLPSYLYLLRHYQENGCEFVSATMIANALKQDQIQVRKDLAVTGIVGKPRVGYSTSLLIESIETYLGWDNVTDAFLVGAGSLGTALLGYRAFEEHGLRIIAAFDIDPDKIGKEIHGKPVLSMSQFPDLATRMHVHLGILTVPAVKAQVTASQMVQGGITGIWNFTHINLSVPDGVVVQNEDLSTGLAVLSRKLVSVQQLQEVDASD